MNQAFAFEGLSAGTTISSFKLNDFMLLLQGDMESAKVQEMVTLAKRNYVDERHKRAISHLTQASGYKKNKWKTYVYVDKKRKEIIRNTKNEIYEALFEFYYAQENRDKTFTEVFDLLCNYKTDCRGRTANTIDDDSRYFGYISEKLKNKSINEITDEDIQRWIVNDLLPKKPKKEALKKNLQILNQIFEYGIKNKMCYDNPMRYISAEDYYQKCDLSKKPDEEKKFSDSERELIREDCLKEKTNPRALMALLADETGMRQGELAGLHVSDIDLESGFIHVHRQQVFNNTGKPRVYSEVPYTKDEKKHPHDGRYVPITDKCKEVIQMALELPGESKYLFHDKKGQWIRKDSYGQNLARRCERLGTLAKNNHAFRIALNDRLIDKGFSPSDRALILGHTVETNETHYSLTDKRRLEDIKNRMK